MENIEKNIWILRREEEKKSGRPVQIYSAYPLIGRGSVIHELPSHKEVEARFEKALSFTLKQKLLFWFRSLFSKGKVNV